LQPWERLGPAGQIVSPPPAVARENRPGRTRPEPPLPMRHGAVMLRAFRAPMVLGLLSVLLIASPRSARGTEPGQQPKVAAAEAALKIQELTAEVERKQKVIAFLKKFLKARDKEIETLQQEINKERARAIAAEERARVSMDRLAALTARLRE